MIGEIINISIKDQVNILLSSDLVSNKNNLDTLSDLVKTLIIVHIKYWKFEDKIEEIEDFSTIGRLKKDTNYLFKVERPFLIKKIDNFILKLLNGQGIEENQKCSLAKHISRHINEMLVVNKDYDLFYSDTVSELLDKMIIIQIRRWYLLNNLSKNNLRKNKLKLKILDSEKIPMIINCFNKLLVLLAKKKVEISPANLKLYKGVN
tara:strand:- start:650 stop:1267 length:618 start_codon:yes stop_codon:yes gene_type:complete